MRRPRISRPSNLLSSSQPVNTRAKIGSWQMLYQSPSSFHLRCCWCRKRGAKSNFCACVPESTAYMSPSNSQICLANAARVLSDQQLGNQPIHVMWTDCQVGLKGHKPQCLCARTCRLSGEMMKCGLTLGALWWHRSATGDCADNLAISADIHDGDGLWVTRFPGHLWAMAVTSLLPTQESVLDCKWLRACP